MRGLGALLKAVCDFYDPAQLNGLVRQVVTEPQELVNAVSTFAVLTATQKTNATRRTIKVYSTKPCPSSSTTNLFKNSIILSPPFFVIMLVCRKGRYYASNL